MDLNKVDQLLMAYGDKLPPESLSYVRERLFQIPDEQQAMLVMTRFKDPTIALILSILCGFFGVDRFYLGDIGLGVGKLLTCGGIYIWWIIDIFLIMNATRQKNLDELMRFFNSFSGWQQ